MTADSARKRVGTTLGSHINFYVDTILTDAGFNAENVSATPPDLRQLCRAVISMRLFHLLVFTALQKRC